MKLRPPKAEDRAVILATGEGWWRCATCLSLGALLGNLVSGTILPPAMKLGALLAQAAVFALLVCRALREQRRLRRLDAWSN
jgi:hypothetical protein